MIDHIGLPVSDFGRAKAFYEAAFAPLGIALLMEVTAEQTGAGAHAGFGRDGKPSFWIGDHGAPVRGLHAAFTAASRAEVDAFYQAAIAAGARDNGAWPAAALSPELLWRVRDRSGRQQYRGRVPPRRDLNHPVLRITYRRSKEVFLF